VDGPGWQTHKRPVDLATFPLPVFGIADGPEFTTTASLEIIGNGNEKSCQGTKGKSPRAPAGHGWTSGGAILQKVVPAGRSTPSSFVGRRAAWVAVAGPGGGGRAAASLAKKLKKKTAAPTAQAQLAPSTAPLDDNCSTLARRQ